ncbi:MAG: hypothetical protein NVSMB64_32970 [Candidatus Velthaea sp.]
MRSLISLLAFFFLTFGTASAAPQPLAVMIDTSGVHTKSLQHYEAGTPIAVVVSSESGGIDAVTVLAIGPDGTTARTPLARSAGGAFTGTIAVQSAGAWSIALETQAGQIRASTSPVAIDVIDPAGNSPWLLGLGLGAVLFALVGVGGFVFLRRSAVQANPSNGRSRAAA